ncbi:hypothetical protein CR513_40614, partial [Mucuna pruriens]
MWKKKERSKWKNSSTKFTKEVKEKSQVVCYEYKKPRHFKYKYPSLEKEKDKKKSFFKKKTFKKKKDLKKKFSKLTKEFCVFQKENDLLKKENKNLKEEKAKSLSKINTSKENEKLQENSLDKFVNGSENYDKKKDLKKDKSTSHCLNCGKFGHLSYDCGDCLKKRHTKPFKNN